MKLVILSLLFGLFTVNAFALEQCDPASKSQVSYESETLKVTFIQGDIAKQAWNNLNVEPTQPKPENGNFGYNTKVKYSENLNCWNYQPARIVNGVDVGPANCDVYSCNVIERK